MKFAKLLIVFAFSLVLLLASQVRGGASWLATWTEDEDCKDWRWDCTPNGKRWPGSPPSAEDSAKRACEELVEVGARSILFVGDSYTRHAFVAMALWLKEDFEQGALIDGHEENCRFEGQFEEKNCRMQVDDKLLVCGGRVRLVLQYGNGFDIFPEQQMHAHDAVVWQGGNHRLRFVLSDAEKEFYHGPAPLHMEQTGVNDPDLLAKYVLAPRCSPGGKLSHVLTHGFKKVVYLDTHASTSDNGRLWQSMDHKESFHLEMPALLREVCGVVHVASAWDASYDLVTNHELDAERMTWDGMHWGVAINLLKAYAVVDAIVDMLRLHPGPYSLSALGPHHHSVGWG